MMGRKKNRADLDSTLQNAESSQDLHYLQETNGYGNKKRQLNYLRMNNGFKKSYFPV